MKPARDIADDALLTTAVQDSPTADKTGALAEFAAWLDEQLDALERRFWDYSTYNSLRRASSR